MNENLAFASDEEMYVYWYIEELLKHNIIFSYDYQPKSFELTKPVNLSYIKEMKTKSKNEQYSFMENCEYTADFKFYWNPDYYLLFFCDYTWNKYNQRHTKISPFIANYSSKKQLYYSVIDVKGTFDKYNNVRLFAIYQKLIYRLYGIYVQKIIPAPKVSKSGKIAPLNALFYDTFIPQRYIGQNKGKGNRKINFPCKMIDEYISERKKLFSSLTTSKLF